MHNRASLQAGTDLNFKTWDGQICQFISLQGYLSSNTAGTAADDLSELLVQYFFNNIKRTRSDSFENALYTMQIQAVKHSKCSGTWISLTFLKAN